MNFTSELEKRTADVESGLCVYLPKETGFQSELWEAMNYSLLSGGKRLRPIFMYETYRLFGGKKEALIRPFMAALEMIHMYSLVHDDLPAMDNDDYRRGRLTTHKKYGEDMGILAGDGLLNYAFETAAQAFLCKGEEQRAGQALAVLAKKAGGYGMIGGQVVDVKSCGQAIDKELLFFIHKHKTAALIEAAMMIGAILAGADCNEVETVEKIAGNVGVAFQIQDDILDVEGDEKLIGKPLHSDEKNEKTTYVTLVGIEKAKQEVEQYSEEAVCLLAGLKRQSDFLESLIQALIRREK